MDSVEDLLKRLEQLNAIDVPRSTSTSRARAISTNARNTGRSRFWLCR